MVSGSIPAHELQDIRKGIRGLLPELASEFGVKTLGVFGSFASGQQGENSDLDLLVEFEETPTIFEFVRLRRFLTQALGHEVDLVMKSALKHDIGARILDEVVPV